MAGAESKRVSIQRVNTWTEKADATLARIVLQNIESGETQLKGFQQAGAILGRTVAACGYRWNGVLRRNYRNDIDKARQIRNVQKRAKADSTNTLQPRTQSITSSEAMRDAIGFLQNFETDFRRAEALVAKLERERDELAGRVRELEEFAENHQQNTSAPLSAERLHSDAQTLVEILQRAKNLVPLQPNTDDESKG